MELIDLPPEILQKIICYLSDEDLCRLRETCSKFRATCDADMVWTALCLSHYGVQFTPTRNSSARIFYQKTLRAFVRNGLLKVRRPPATSLWLWIWLFREAFKKKPFFCDKCHTCSNPPPLVWWKTICLFWSKMASSGGENFLATKTQLNKS